MFIMLRSSFGASLCQTMRLLPRSEQRSGSFLSRADVGKRLFKYNTSAGVQMLHTPVNVQESESDMWRRIPSAGCYPNPPLPAPAEHGTTQLLPSRWYPLLWRIQACRHVAE